MGAAPRPETHTTSVDWAMGWETKIDHPSRLSVARMGSAPNTAERNRIHRLYH
ncbi:MAG: hypothetical protein QOH27_4200 [Mycobacterium sp.]|nr:hypothetical protein [Mycobacterium sp.]